jgi:hypothetical protein
VAEREASAVAGDEQNVEQKLQIAETRHFLAVFILYSPLIVYIFVAVSIILTSRQGATRRRTVVPLPHLHLESMK